MYNSELKKEYIAVASERNLTAAKFLPRTFKYTEGYEEMLGKDCCEFTVPEIMNHLKGLCTTSFECLNCELCQLKKYAEYCIAQGRVKDNQNHYCEFSKDMLMNCLNVGLGNEKILSRKDLMSVLETVNNISEKAFLLGLFEGICGKQYEDLRSIQITDFVDGKIKLKSGRVQSYSSELYEYCLESKDEYTYYAYCEDGSVRPLMYRSDDKNIFKVMYNSTDVGITYQQMYYKLKRIQKNTGLKYLTSNSLLESGKIEMINNLAKEYGVSCEHILTTKAFRKMVTDVYGNFTSIDTFITKYKHKFNR